ncbi:MAG: hypothetical protein WD534_08290 [Phycisphaeraceae bacterium]
MLAIPSRVIASCFALVSFAAALLVGLLSGNGAGVIIWRATLVMLACWVIGWIVGLVAQRVVDDHIQTYKQNNPIPGEADAEAGVEETSITEGPAEQRTAA